MSKKSPMKDPFITLTENSECQPHIFKAYRYNIENNKCWQAVVEGCLESWRVKAAGFYENVTETGFKKTRLEKMLNIHGEKRLPDTPSEDTEVTRKPQITDMTEVLAIQSLKWHRNDLIFPYPRVLHKEVYPLQHHGIDVIGYTKNEDEYTLYIIEVMASIEGKHPPKTVKDHYKQILPDTLDAPNPERLLIDLQTVHDESSDEHKDILNSFIISICDDSICSENAVIAAPVLIRRSDEFDINDWGPFLNETKSFETARIPSTILFIALECHNTFSGLLDLIKKSASGKDSKNETKEI